MTDTIARLNESLAGRYTIERELGAGGMATVYLGHDLKHDRHVAIKVLKPELGAVLGVERFLSEIKVTANLQHPNLLPLFDSGEASGLLFYVMPLVDGESLRARLEREKQLPVEEAVRISVAIANALAYAHDHGVIHRDLKPENILLQSGQPVVADFGIALAVSNAGGARVTQTGLSLGTPQYMSPEQATGDRVIDARSDIYSLGAMTYEMLAGEPPHGGTSAQAIIAKLLTETPASIRSRRPSVPEHVELAVEGALEKLPADRIGTAREFAELLQGRGSARATSLRPRRESKRTIAARVRDPVTTGVAALAIAVTVIAMLLTRSVAAPTPGRAIRFVIAGSDSTRPVVVSQQGPAAISSDGGMIAFFGSNGMLNLLPTDRVESRPIPGTEGGFEPFFSPDGQWLTFEKAGGLLMKVRLDGSAPVRLNDGAAGNGVEWTIRDEIIIGSGVKVPGLGRMKAANGEIAPLTRLDSARGDKSHVWPVATPDGKLVVFAIWRGSLELSELATVSIDGGSASLLGIKAVRPVAILDNTLIYVRADGAVMGIGLDVANRRTRGAAVSVHAAVEVTPGHNGNSGIFVSRGGASLAVSGQLSGQLAWLTRSGALQPVSNTLRNFESPRASADGRRIAVTVSEADGKRDVWLYDIATTTFSRLTSLGTVASFDWSSDGNSVIVNALTAEGGSAVWSQPVSGGAARRLDQEADRRRSTALTADGKTMLFVATPFGSWGIMQKSLDPPSAARVWFDTKATDEDPHFSPDGKWVAFTSDESGRTEVLVRSFPGTGTQVQISDAGGVFPKWSRDGKHLLYNLGDAIVQATLETTPTLRVVARETVFRGVEPYTQAAFDIAPDGSKMLIVRLMSDTRRIVASPNWIVEFRQRMAEAGAKR